MDIGIENPEYEIVEAPDEQPTEQPSTLPAPATPAPVEQPVPAGA